MRRFLDMQVEEKKRNEEFEKNVNCHQASIWKTDTANFINQERQIYDKVSLIFG